MSKNRPTGRYYYVTDYACGTCITNPAFGEIRINPMDDENNTRRFVELYSKAEPSVRAFVNSLVVSWVDAEDIIQSTAVVLWEKFDTFEEGASFVTWACGIAKYEVLMHYRRESRSPLRFSGEFVDAVSREVVAEREFSDRDSAMFECIAELPARHRELIELRYGKGLPAEKLAEKLGQSVGSLYKACSRVRKSLVECVNRKLGREVRK